MTRLDEVRQGILEMLKEVPTTQSLLVGISGIDASGKGYVSAKLANALATDLQVAVINGDGWLNLRHIRFDNTEPGQHFYDNALRLDQMFERLVLPLKLNRGIKTTLDVVDETAVEFCPHERVYENIDVILLEGIFLFKQAFVEHFDMRIWIDCSLETALNRAIVRSQEGLSPGETI